ncbi:MULTISPECIES: hypothetical protein [unclassified Streptomyces]|uniref:hypothetical protein n=1 Tax=unclassified Streptomyces TaxID=2593676 RepID=UPI0011B05D8A|nr:MULTISPECIES: hypothetical protein [unclassified Streptomyces]
MSETDERRVITPTRVIPAGAPLPEPEESGGPGPEPRYRPGPTEIPTGPVPGDGLPPWRRPREQSPPSPPPGGAGGSAPAPRESAPGTRQADHAKPREARGTPVPDSGEIRVRLHPDDVRAIRDALVPVEHVPLPWWRRAVARMRPWATFAGFGLAVIPVPWTGYSAAATWAYSVHYAREVGGIHFGYALAAGALAFSSILIARAANYPQILLSRCTVACAIVGLSGAIHFWDPIQALTGVPL